MSIPCLQRCEVKAPSPLSSSMMLPTLETPTAPHFFLLQDWPGQDRIARSSVDSSRRDRRRCVVTADPTGVARGWRCCPWRYRTALIGECMRRSQGPSESRSSEEWRKSIIVVPIVGHVEVELHKAQLRGFCREVSPTAVITADVTLWSNAVTDAPSLCTRGDASLEVPARQRVTLSGGSSTEYLPPYRRRCHVRMSQLATARSREERACRG